MARFFSPRTSVTALSYSQVYEEIAEHFSDTRHKPWPRVVEFVQAQPPVIAVINLLSLQAKIPIVLHVLYSNCTQIGEEFDFFIMYFFIYLTLNGPL